MLDFSVSEIGLIGVVALIAIGPERLPKVARAAGVLMGRFRRYASSVKADIDREIQQAELKELQKRMNEAVLEADKAMAASAREAEAVLSSPVAPAAGPPSVEESQTTLPPQQAQVQQAPESVVSTPHQVAAPFGGDPFSVRPSSPLRSKPMTQQQSRLPLEDEQTG
jgi:sec-independent protein translocase protein TatB